MRHGLTAGLLMLALMGAAPEPSSPHSRSSPIALTPDGLLVCVVNPDSSSLSILDARSNQRVAEVALGGTPQTVAVSDDTAYVAMRERGVAVVDLARRSIRATIPGFVDAFGVAVAHDRFYVSDHGAARVRVFDRETLAGLGEVITESHPRGLAVDGAGTAVYVTHFRSGRLSIIDPVMLTVRSVVPVLADANLSQSVTLSGDGRRAYLPQTRSNATNPALLFDTTLFPIVTVIDLAIGQTLDRERFSLDVVDRPVNMPLDAVIAGGKLYVANAGSEDVSVIDLEKRSAVAHIAVAKNPRGIAVSPDEQRLYVNNVLSGTVSVIDAATDTVIATVPSTTIPLPEEILNGKRLFHSSSSEALARDRWISCASCHFDGGADGRTWFFRDGPRNTTPLFNVARTLPMHWSGDLDELQDVENTIRTVQAGTGLADGPSHCLPACDGPEKNGGRSKGLDDLAAFMRSIPPPPPPPAHPASARGQALFFDARAGCATCHPAPFFTDALRHDVGTGNGSQERKGAAFDTPSLRGAFDTAPYLHDGSAPTLESAIRRHTTTSLSDGEVSDIATFIGTIPHAYQRRRSVR